MHAHTHIHMKTINRPEILVVTMWCTNIAKMDKRVLGCRKWEYMEEWLLLEAGYWIISWGILY